MTMLGRFESMWAVTAAGWAAGLVLYPWLTQDRVSGPAIALVCIIGAIVSPMIGAGVLSLIAGIQEDWLHNDGQRWDMFVPSVIVATALCFLIVLLALWIAST